MPLLDYIAVELALKKKQGSGYPYQVEMKVKVTNEDELGDRTVAEILTGWTLQIAASSVKDKEQYGHLMLHSSNPGYSLQELQGEDLQLIISSDPTVKKVFYLDFDFDENGALEKLFGNLAEQSILTEDVAMVITATASVKESSNGTPEIKKIAEHRPAHMKLGPRQTPPISELVYLVTGDNKLGGELIVLADTEGLVAEYDSAGDPIMVNSVDQHVNIIVCINYLNAQLVKGAKQLEEGEASVYAGIEDTISIINIRGRIASKSELPGQVFQYTIEFEIGGFTDPPPQVPGWASICRRSTQHPGSHP